MSRLSDFLQVSLLAVHHGRQLLPTSIVPAAARVALSAGVYSYLTALASSSICRNLTTISISVVRDVNYFAAYMASFRLTLYDIFFRAFLGWT